MDEVKIEVVREWMTKAKHDLLAAQHLWASRIGVSDVVVSHCQQAAEKAVKGFLTFHEQLAPKSHDIERLIGLVAPFESGFLAWKDVATRLTPYATANRYPSKSEDPGPEETDQALRDATGLYDYALSLLPNSTHPATETSNGPSLNESVPEPHADAP